MSNEGKNEPGPEHERGEKTGESNVSNPPLTRRATSGGATLWIGVGVVFALMALAWTAMFFFSTKYRPATVPMEQREEAR